MKKQTQNNNLNILRWVLLASAVLLTGYIVLLLLAYITSFVVNFSNFKTPLMIIWFLLQSIVIYFVARYIAPSHKNVAGWVSIILFPLFTIILFGLYYFGF